MYFVDGNREVRAAKALGRVGKVVVIQLPLVSVTSTDLACKAVLSLTSALVSVPYRPHIFRQDQGVPTRANGALIRELHFIRTARRRVHRNGKRTRRDRALLGRWRVKTLKMSLLAPIAKRILELRAGPGLHPTTLTGGFAGLRRAV